MVMAFGLLVTLYGDKLSPRDKGEDSKLEHLAGGMLMVGFFGTEAPRDSMICRAIHHYHLGGVILFDRDPTDPKRPKNIRDKDQLRRLTRQLQACSPDGRLLIAVDEEGGAVQRLKKKQGFYGAYPRASNVAKKGEPYAKRTYAHMARELADVGINFDLAPVVDLALNPKNRVIVGWGRSYGKDPATVSRYAGIFIRQMHRQGILTSLKHFPGHGSSTGDTHKGFVDVTGQWRERELEPYRRLIGAGLADTVMVAHIFNRAFDPMLPASLSHETVTKRLRGNLGYRGVVITDDLQMGAIAKRYSLPETLRLAILAGNDLLLFGNQLDPKRIYSPDKLVNIIMKMVRNGKISEQRLYDSARRLATLKKSF